MVMVRPRTQSSEKSASVLTRSMSGASEPSGRPSSCCFDRGILGTGQGTPQRVSATSPCGPKSRDNSLSLASGEIQGAWRGTGIGKAVASALFEDLSARGFWCHWVMLAENEGSQRLARLRRIVSEATINTYLWT